MTEWNIAFDIGGTNIRAGLIKNTKKSSQFLITKHYLTQDFKTATELVKEALKDFQIDSVEKAFFSIAGPVHNQKKTHLTTVEFSLERRSILSTKKVKETYFCNDLYAMAAALPNYPQEEMNIFQSGDLENFPNRIGILAVGTGLGGAILAYDFETKSYDLLDSEMGHVSFPVENKEELKVFEFIQKKTKREHISRDAFVSGKALSYLYEFKTKKEKSPAEIVKLKTKEKEAKETINDFMKYFGRISKDWALELNLDSIVLAGGVLAHNKNFPKAPFLKEFRTHTYYSQELKEIPIYSIHDDFLALKGLIELMK